MKKNYMISFANKIYSYNRSVVSLEVLKTLKIIKKKLKKLKIVSVKSGSKIFDWKIPKEWKSISAKVIDKNKNVIMEKDNS